MTILSRLAVMDTIISQELPAMRELLEQMVQTQTPPSGGAFPVGDSFPTAPTVNDIFFHNTYHQPFYFDGSGWWSTTLFQADMVHRQYGFTAIDDNALYALPIQPSIKIEAVNMRMSINGTNDNDNWLQWELNADGTPLMQNDTRGYVNQPTINLSYSGTIPAIVNDYIQWRVNHWEGTPPGYTVNFSFWYRYQAWG